MKTPDTWVPAYVGLGSNLDDPVRQVRIALDELAALRETRLIAASALYRNPPFGPVSQPDFVNAAAGLLTRLAPQDLWAALKSIEKAHGRVQGESTRWGPRTLDLDLLVFGTATIETAQLTLPHPGISGRNFVLLPLAEIAPGLTIPGLGNVGELAARLDKAGLQRID